MTTNKEIGNLNSGIKEVKMEAEQIEQITKPIRRFDIKTEAKVIKAISKLFNAEGDITEEEAVKLEHALIIDITNVSMLIAKTEEAKRVLARFIKRDKVIATIEPTLTYAEIAELKQIAKCKYSTFYLNPIMALFSIFAGETVELTIAKDFPLTAENKHFRFILAPRIESQ